MIPKFFSFHHYLLVLILCNVELETQVGKFVLHLIRKHLLVGFSDFLIKDWLLKFINSLD